MINVNTVLFKIPKTAGENMRTKASRGIVRPLYSEGYFMQTRPLDKNYVAPDKTNPIVKLFKRMKEEFIGIINAMKPEKEIDYEDMYINSLLRNPQKG